MTSVAAGSGLALDPRLFTTAAIDPETAAFNAQLVISTRGVPPIWTLPAAVTRQAREEGRGAYGPLVLSDMASTRSIDTAIGQRTIRTFVPETVTGVYLFLHGGGWTLGGAHHADPNLEQTARTARVAIVSAEYRLGPEHPYPAGPDDCEAIALWLIENAQKEFGSNRLMIGGESAGAHLSVVTLLRLRDKHQMQSAFEKANLVFGCYDLAGTPSVRLAPAETLVLPPQAIDWFVEQFGVTDRLRDPDVSPIWADLREMPSALFSVGTLDPLVDDSLFMYGRWIAAGNAAELAVYPGGVHNFTNLACGLGQRAVQRSIDFLAGA